MDEPHTEMDCLKQQVENADLWYERIRKDHAKLVARLENRVRIAEDAVRKVQAAMADWTTEWIAESLDLGPA